MNVKLRKRHRYMWFIIGIGLPLLCLEILEDIKLRPIAEIPRVSCPLDMTTCGITERHEISDHSMQMSVATRNGVGVVEINYTQPIVSAMTIAYLSDSEELGSNAKLLGGLNEMGSYSFEMNDSDLNGMTHIIVYDQLKSNSLYVQPINELKP